MEEGGFHANSHLLCLSCLGLVLSFSPKTPFLQGTGWNFMVQQSGWGLLWSWLESIHFKLKSCFLLIYHLILKILDHIVIITLLPFWHLLSIIWITSPLPLWGWFLCWYDMFSILFMGRFSHVSKVILVEYLDQSGSWFNLRSHPISLSTEFHLRFDMGIRWVICVNRVVIQALYLLTCQPFCVIVL